MCCKHDAMHRYDRTGSKAHEAFIHNVAMGRLDVYTFDLWYSSMSMRVHVLMRQEFT